MEEARRTGWLAQLLLCGLMCAALAPEHAEGAWVPILSDQMVTGSLRSNESLCYRYHMDDATTKLAVQWTERRLLIRLDPCSGLPHMKVSVYGCPSDGNLVTWEYMDEVMKNDLRAADRPVPKDWEWPGDIETLFLDVTHRTFYIEISQYHWPMLYPSHFFDLAEQLRAGGYEDEANTVTALVPKPNRTNAVEIEEAKASGLVGRMQDLVIPNATFELAATLHQGEEVPRSKVYPIAFAEGWVKDIFYRKEIGRGVSFVPDVTASYYQIVWWPPTRTPNDTVVDPTMVNISQNFSGLRRLLEEGRLPLDSEGPREGEDAQDAGQRGDTLPGGEGARDAGQRDTEQCEAEIQETDAQLGILRARNLDAVRRVLERERGGAGEATLSRRAAAGEAGGDARAHSGGGEAQDGHAGARRAMIMGLLERAVFPTKAEDLQFMIYTEDITQAMQDKWGVLVHASGATLTRLESAPCPIASDVQCGTVEYIARRDFRRIDADGDGFVTQWEYLAEYPYSRQATDDGFSRGTTFEVASRNSTTAGIDLATWVTVYIGKLDPFLASIKDATRRTMWTVCGISKFGTPLQGGPNETTDDQGLTWMPMTSITQQEDGRLTYILSHLLDDDNNIYLLNIIVQNTRTGERAAFRPHTVQRNTPVYNPPELGGTDTALMTGIGLSIGVVAIVIAILIAQNRNKKMRPRLRIRKNPNPEKSRAI